MKKKILVFIIVIAILLIPIYSKYSEKKEMNLRAEQLEKDFIDEFYIKAKKDYYSYKKAIESHQLLDKNYLPYVSESKLHQIMDDYIQLEKKYNRKASNSDEFKEYYHIACMADFTYIDAYIESQVSNFSRLNTLIDFDKLQKYIDTVDDIIQKYNLLPLYN